jgi:hypothetical protein
MLNFRRAGFCAAMLAAVCALCGCRSKPTYPMAKQFAVVDAKHPAAPATQLSQPLGQAKPAPLQVMTRPPAAEPLPILQR